MNDHKRNRQLENYQRYLNKAISGELADISPEISTAKLISLFLALRRNEIGLHLRWNKLESIQLGLITVEEVLAKHPKTITEQKLQEAIKVLGKGGDEVILKLILESYESLENVESEKQRNRAKTQRAPSPVERRIGDLLKTYPEISNEQIHSELADEFEVYDGFYEFANPSKPDQTKKIAISSVKNIATKIRKRQPFKKNSH